MIYASAIQFPDCLAFGSQRRAGWHTTLTQVLSGAEGTNQDWSRSRRQFDVGLAVRTASLYDIAEQHFHSARGKAKAYPFRDPLDHFVAPDRGLVIATEEAGVYQLVKRYGTGDDVYLRVITRPAEAATIYRLRGATTTDITSAATIDLGGATTKLPGGLVEFTGGTILPGDVISWSGSFFVPCRYDVDEFPGVIVNREPGPDGELYVECSTLPVVEVRDAA